MRILLISLFCLSLGPLWAQTDSTRNQGEILTGEVIIEKEKKIVLPQADKIFLKSTLKSFSNDPLNLSFEIKEPSFEWPDYKSDVPFQFIEEPYPLAEYQNYVKLGYGNYNSPLFEAGLFQTFGSFETQAKLFYESFKSGPIKDENSGNSLAGVELSTTYQSSTIHITPSLSFFRREYSYYGNAGRSAVAFPDNPDDAALDSFDFSVSLEGGKKDFTYELTPFLSTTNQKIAPNSEFNKENIFGTSGAFAYAIDDAYVTGIVMDATSGQYKSGINYNRSLINLNPWVTYKKDNIQVNAGFLISAGKVAEESKTGFYPKIRVDYELTDKWVVYGALSGGQSWYDLNSLLDEHEFLDDSLTLTLMENSIRFGGGLKGNPVKNLLFEASLNYSSVNGMPFYTSSSSDSSRYTLSYDTDDVGIVSLKSTLSFMPTATSTYGAELQLNGYSVEALDKPWHQPTYVFKAFTSHNIKEKLIVSAYLTSIGGIRAPANVDFGYVKLAGFTDVGIGAKYLITKQASAFIDVNNLLNNEYERYLGYPTRGLAFKIGGQYRF